MRTEKELLELLKDVDIVSYKVNAEIDKSNSMELASIEELIHFSCKHDIDSMFYHYGFIDEELLEINDEVISNLRLDEATLSVLQHEFDEYNKNISKLDFSNPVSLNLYCIHQGVILFIQENDYWFIEQGFDMPETACLKLANEYFEDIVGEKKKRKQEIIKGRKKLREQILNDDEFKVCSNRELRKAYIQKVFVCDGAYPYRHLFYTEKGVPFDILVSAFVDEIWKEYKASLKNKVEGYP